MFQFITVTVVTPWLDKGYYEFVVVNDAMTKVTGDFVHVLIMFGCRPALTVVAFRCIEQIIHQLIGIHRHDEDHEAHPEISHEATGSEAELEMGAYMLMPTDNKTLQLIEDNSKVISFEHINGIIPF